MAWTNLSQEIAEELEEFQSPYYAAAETLIFLRREDLNRYIREYRATGAGSAKRREYERSPARVAARKEYRRRARLRAPEEQKAKERERDAIRRAKRKAARAPRKHKSTPEYRERKRRYMAEYRKRESVKEKRREEYQRRNASRGQVAYDAHVVDGARQVAREADTRHAAGLPVRRADG